MTLENAKKLYNHYLETGETDKAKEIAAGRPEVVEVEEEKPKKRGRR